MSEKRVNGRDRDIAYHGALTVRVVDRMMQFRVDRATALVHAKTKSEMELGADLDRFAEAKALIAIVRAHDGPSGIDAHNDAGEGERLYGLAVGHVLTEQDIRDIESLLADHNDAIGHEADKWHEARIATLREIGGDELVAAAEAKDHAICSDAVERALAGFRKRTAELSAGKPRRCDTDEIALDGSCIFCGADQGVACRGQAT
jgi:hypothetical protein